MGSRLATMLILALLPLRALASPAYDILGISAQASPQQVDQAYARLKARPDLSDAQRSQARAAYLILSNPELRQKYDAGVAEQGEVSVPAQDRAKLASIFRGIDPSTSRKILAKGQVAASSLVDAGIYYVILAASSYWKCGTTHDASYCEQFLSGLKDPGMYLGYGLFIAAAKGTSAVATTLSKAIGPILSSSLGLGVAGMISQLGTELLDNPDMKQWWAARKIKDPKKRQQTRDAAKKKLWQDTFANTDWRSQHYPAFATQVLAAAASGLTMKGIGVGLQKGTALSARAAASHDSLILNCVAAGLRTLNSGYTKLAKNRILMTSAQLSLFMGWAGVLQSPTNWLYNVATTNRELDDIRKQKPANEAALKTYLEKSSDLWDESRRDRMAPAFELMSVHEAQLNSYDQATQEANLFYTWFLDGFSPDSLEWQTLQSTYYDVGTTPDMVQGDVDKYLRAFFCGPDVSQAFHDSKDDYGIPIPSKVVPSVTPYRVVPTVDPKLCAGSISDLKKALQSGDYQEDVRDTYAKLQEIVGQARVKKVEFYEGRVQKDIVGELSGKSGVLASFDAQLSDLKALQKNAAAGSASAADIAQAIDNVEQEKDSATQLLNYFQTPMAQRQPPSTDLSALLAAFDPGDQPEWQTMIQYFDSFILQ